MEQGDLIEDIDALQLAQSEQIFTKASNRFIRKWNRKESTFIEYFQKEWLTSHRGWYEDIQQLTPSTNNDLESNNKVIKDENTFRERLPLGLKQFHDEQTVTLDIWPSSYQWVKLDKSVVSIELENEIEFYIPGGQQLSISKNEIDVMKKLKWYSFDQYKAKAFNIWHVILPMDSAKWLNGQCNCPVYFKKFMCKYIVGLAIRLNYCKPPPAAKNIPIGEKRRRDRPSKAKKALLIQ
ncbi:unnamed protein product [Adineta steineri]|uniref:SWIM-type domain-containing protein n=1 Tax=Adineta steineri TaxID=433720 RepID=A0A819MKK3_9BILA|nr:unnamed protein product [Adineta steineri]